MSKPQLKVYIDLVSPFAYIAFQILTVSESCTCCGICFDMDGLNHIYCDADKPRLMYISIAFFDYLLQYS